ncbi:MAG: hypothetical protein A49_21100 [Methyloceanibacter sp.]|nr:MAG: hypothetical protein A49_21100 [Methyloceanibacter sp.]
MAELGKTKYSFDSRIEARSIEYRIVAKQRDRNSDIDSRYSPFGTTIIALSSRGGLATSKRVIEYTPAGFTQAADRT